MGTADLRGRSILILEDEPLVALGIAEEFRAAGAAVLTAFNLHDGLRLAGHPDLSAAVLDFGLRDGEGTALCMQLDERGIPYVLHSGYADVAQSWPGVSIPKPAASGELVSAIAGLLGSEDSVR